MSLWLTEQSTPMTSDAWEAIFAQASACCSRLGYDLYVTPHMLRHTFAVHMLAQLIRAKIGALFERAPNATDLLADLPAPRVKPSGKIIKQPLIKPSQRWLQKNDHTSWRFSRLWIKQMRIRTNHQKIPDRIGY